MPFLCFCSRFPGNQKREAETSKRFNLLIKGIDGLSPSQFQGVHKYDILIVIYLLLLNIPVHYIVNIQAINTGEPNRQRAGQMRNFLRVLRYNKRICYVSKKNTASQSSGCFICEDLFSRALHLQLHLTTCSERVKDAYPKNVNRIRKRFCNELEFFGIKHISEQKRFKKLTFFNIESISVQNEPSKTQIQQPRYANMSRCLYPISQTSS